MIVEYTKAGVVKHNVSYTTERRRGMSDIVKASDCKCCECGEQAVALWPVIDPDIPSYPYCRKCLDKAKAELMRQLIGIDEKYKKK